MVIKQTRVAAIVFTLLAIVGSFSLSLLINQNTYADYSPTNGKCEDGTAPTKVPVNQVPTKCDDSTKKSSTPTGDAAQGTDGTKQTGDSTDDDGTETCAIEKLGWILCPVIETSGKIGDQAFQFLAKNFLQTEPELVSSSNSGTKVAWELARNIANILFIAAFLIIILSQVTGRGLDNYGIKKLLPKLIIAAVAVNVSYYICQLMVDLTNILGYEIQNFMVDTARQVTTSVVMPPQTSLDIQTSSGTLGQIAAGVLGVAAVVWFLLPVLFLGVSTVVITCLVIIAILLMRKAFIVLLVVLSPIAFVAYLLPNTEKYFQKWLNMFWQLLLVFPIVGLLFGAGQLASAIILVSGSSRTTDTTVQNQTTQSIYSDSGKKCIQVPRVDASGNVISPASVKTCGQGSTPFMLGLVAAGISVAPLIAVWAVLKGALSAAGAIGGKIAGAIQTAGNGANRFARKPEDALRKSAFDAAKMGIATRALDSNNGIGRFVRRRQLSGERRKAAFDAAKARFDGDSAGGADIAQDIMRDKEFTSAANVAAQRDYLKRVSTDSDFKNGAVNGRLSDSLTDALATQEKRATDEVIKAIKEGFHTTDIEDKKDANGKVIEKGIRTALAEALASGNVLQAKAMQDMLMGSGNAGRKAFRAEYASAERAGSIAAGDGMDTALRQNIQTNNAGAKEKDAALKAWADKGGQSYTNAWENGDWKNVDTVQKFAALDGDAQLQAIKQLSLSNPSQLAQIRTGLAKNPAARDTLDLKVRQLWKI